ncbi:hypothetical protein LVQ78_23805 [Buttiauxella sp. A2-C2_NF]|uniref:hypothetical protein n=1 Tax=Buttiauxella ferragutiae TaxID=82989 RepID=UPI001E4693E1|nr:hypothetical protein [Buttiauxella ferragutiae]MCE0829013.1 hypothetical protein [Buttiauxella ferragutiae]UNK63076.1 hypothetical protein MNO13_09225 [Buttiauxella ferragutiae]
MTEKLIKIDCNYSLYNSQLEGMRYSSGTLELVLTSEGTNKFKVVFDWIHSFRLTDEGDLLKMQEEQNGEMLTGIYVVDKSTYLEWFTDQSIGIHDGESITHYLIVTSNDVIDVLSSVTPLISVC